MKKANQQSKAKPQKTDDKMEEVLTDLENAPGDGRAARAQKCSLDKESQTKQQSETLNLSQDSLRQKRKRNRNNSGCSYPELISDQSVKETVDEEGVVLQVNAKTIDYDFSDVDVTSESSESSSSSSSSEESEDETPKPQKKTIASQTKVR